MPEQIAPMFNIDSTGNPWLASKGLPDPFNLQLPDRAVVMFAADSILVPSANDPFVRDLAMSSTSIRNSTLSFQATEVCRNT